MNRKICNEDLTFVIQGPIINQANLPVTENLIKDVKKFFPGSAIILSTWDYEDTNSFEEFVPVVKSPDPGGQIGWLTSGTINNVNRQIVSTYTGLQNVKSKYGVKLRSDMSIKNNKILHQLNSRVNRLQISDWDVLTELVLITNVTSYNPRFLRRRIHHPCDWFYAGLTTDLMQIWNIPLMPQEWFTWFTGPNNSTIESIKNDQICRYDPEEYVWSRLLEKQVALQFSDSFDVTDENIEVSEVFIARNLQLTTNTNLGIRSTTHPNANSLLPFSYTPFDWVKIATKNNVNSIKFPDIYSIRVYISRFGIMLKIMARKLIK
jgi:hypothetical protein